MLMTLGLCNSNVKTTDLTSEDYDSPLSTKILSNSPGKYNSNSVGINLIRSLLAWLYGLECSYQLENSLIWSYYVNSNYTKEWTELISWLLHPYYRNLWEYTDPQSLKTGTYMLVCKPLQVTLCPKMIHFTWKNCRRCLLNG